MATKTHLEIKGLAGFKRALKNAPKVAAPIMQKAINKALIDIQTESVKRTPWDTRELKKSQQRNVKFGGLSAMFWSDKKYAYIQHEGNFRHPRGGERKFMENAIKHKMQATVKTLEDGIEKILKTIKSTSKF